MVPGINADPSKFVQKPKPRPYQKPINQHSMVEEPMKKHNTVDVTNKRSVAIGTEEP